MIGTQWLYSGLVPHDMSGMRSSTVMVSRGFSPASLARAAGTADRWPGCPLYRSPPIAFRCRTYSAHTRQSRLDSGLDFDFFLARSLSPPPFLSLARSRGSTARHVRDEELDGDGLAGLLARLHTPALWFSEKLENTETRKPDAKFRVFWFRACLGFSEKGR